MASREGKQLTARLPYSVGDYVWIALGIRSLVSHEPPESQAVASKALHIWNAADPVHVKPLMKMLQADAQSFLKGQSWYRGIIRRLLVIRFPRD